ncbi:MAG TPA: DNA-processing protein DprA [Geomonas sp.]|nr:DNA-processing protein DprA [Geomonas sp.]
MVRTAAPLHTLGNLDLLDLYKVAFLCSRKCPASVLPASLAWASLQRENGTCVISGYHSAVEKEVLYCLLEGRQPIVIALARGIMEKPEPCVQQALDDGRLLIVTRYAPSVTHACEESCYHRNRLMVAMADEAVVAYAAPGGKLERLCREAAGCRMSFLGG